MTSAPAAVAALAAGRLFEGPPALTVLDPGAPWVVRPESFASKSRNCPFTGWRGTGRVVATLFGDRLVRSAAPGASETAREGM
jgi:dihydroorotase